MLRIGDAAGIAIVKLVAVVSVVKVVAVVEVVVVITAVDQVVVVELVAVVAVVAVVNVAAVVGQAVVADVDDLVKRSFQLTRWPKCFTIFEQILNRPLLLKCPKDFCRRL